ncbi:MAG: hypothetical protein IPG49_07740 [Proteobacteria bacterium]|nr:hypothetical protein [Pseudomonadota bacterium]
MISKMAFTGRMPGCFGVDTVYDQQHTLDVTSRWRGWLMVVTSAATSAPGWR